MAEWLKAADCKSAGLMTYGGSNPPLSTNRSQKSEIRNQKRSPFLVSGFELLVSSRAGVTQLVESQPSKLLVAGSSPVSRSKGKGQKVQEMRRRASVVSRQGKRWLEVRSGGQKHFCLLLSAL